jgi:hypothetical protein
MAAEQRYDNQIQIPDFAIRMSFMPRALHPAPTWAW